MREQKMTRVGLADVVVPWGDHPERPPNHAPGVLLGIYEQKEAGGDYDGTEVRMLPDAARKFAQRILHYAERAEASA